MTRPNKAGELCAGFYSHGPLTIGGSLPMVEVRVPTADGNLTTILVMDPRT